MAEKYVILGTAHGENVAGKRSPDGRFREYEFSRRVVAAVKTKLEAKGNKVFVDMPEAKVPMPQSAELSKRVAIVNGLCKKYGAGNCVYVSIHVDAAGSGKEWKTAGGWTAYTSVGKTKADALAECLYDAAEKYLFVYADYMAFAKKLGAYDAKQKPIRIDKSDGDRDKEANFYVLRKTACPAVLTENLFQDNRADVDFLQSEDGFNAIVGLHVEGIDKYLKGN